MARTTDRNQCSPLPLFGIQSCCHFALYATSLVVFSRNCCAIARKPQRRSYERAVCSLFAMGSAVLIVERCVHLMQCLSMRRDESARSPKGN
jgi:hypothetical protein